MPLALLDDGDDVAHVHSNGGATLAFGLAIDGDDAAAGPRRLDLLSQPGRAGDRRSMLLTAAVAAVVTGIIVGGLSLVAAPSSSAVDEQVAAVENRIGALTSQLASDPGPADAATDLLQRGELATAVGREGVDWAGLLSEIAAQHPHAAAPSWRSRAAGPCSRQKAPSRRASRS